MASDDQVASEISLSEFLTTRSKRLLGMHLDSTAARGQFRDGTV
jgi:hypothetical protein